MSLCRDNCLKTYRLQSFSFLNLIQKVDYMNPLIWVATFDDLLDMNKISDGKKYSRLGGLDINFHHDLMAYSIDETGAEVYTIYVKDLKSGKTLDYNIENTGGRVLFSPDNKLYYNTIDEIKRS